MAPGAEDYLLDDGDSVLVADRDKLLVILDLDDEVGEGRDHRERFCMLRYLRFLDGDNHLPLPLGIQKAAKGEDPPDFTLHWPDGRLERFEMTDGSTSEYQAALARAAGDEPDDLFLSVSKSDRPRNLRSRDAEGLWARTIFSAFQRKADMLVAGRFSLEHLIIYDVTGLSRLLPLERVRPLLQQLLDEWNEGERPEHRFERVSVLREEALLLDVGAEAQVLRSTSPYFRLKAVRASDENDLKRRLRELDRYCRENSIRHLKLFGSVLRDRDVSGRDEDGSRLFREDSDLDLLVEFEPEARVTLLDMARMQRELSELIGFKIDLRTAGDLSRYFRQEVLDQAVAIHA